MNHYEADDRIRGYILYIVLGAMAMGAICAVVEVTLEETARAYEPPLDVPPPPAHPKILTHGYEPVTVTPRLVSIARIKYKDTDREGFKLKVAFETEDGRLPNTVGFLLFTTLKGWELLHGGDNIILGQNFPQIGYNCIRPKTAMVTLYFGRYDFVLSEEDKRFYNPEPQPFEEFKEPLEDYFFVKVQGASVYTEARMVQEEFQEALIQYERAHPDENFSSGIENGLGGVHRNSQRPLTVLYWADVSEEVLAKGKKTVERLAKEHGIKVAVKRSDRLWSGGFVDEQIEIVDPPELKEPNE